MKLRDAHPRLYEMLRSRDVGQRIQAVELATALSKPIDEPTLRFLERHGLEGLAESVRHLFDGYVIRLYRGTSATGLVLFVARLDVLDASPSGAFAALEERHWFLWVRENGMQSMGPRSFLRTLKAVNHLKMQKTTEGE